MPLASRFEIVSNTARKQIGRFLIVGATTVLIDFLTYRLLIWLGLFIWISKAIGFITGTIFAYFANKTWTFQAKVGGKKVFAKFLFVYFTNLCVNVSVNSGVVVFWGREEIALWSAFVIATACSATLNFLGMKFLVFDQKRIPATSYERSL